METRIIIQLGHVQEVQTNINKTKKQEGPLQQPETFMGYNEIVHIWEQSRRQSPQERCRKEANIT
jgi:hypothetical protein